MPKLPGFSSPVWFPALHVRCAQSQSSVHLSKVRSAERDGSTNGPLDGPAPTLPCRCIVVRRKIMLFDRFKAAKKSARVVIRVRAREVADSYAKPEINFRLIRLVGNAYRFI